MYKSRTLLLLAAFSFAVPAFAADDHNHEDQKTVTGTAAKPAEPMQMHKMREQMEKIHATTDPKERQKLMHQHMSSMHDMMGMMKNEQGMKSGADMAKRTAHMERRMERMEMMMDQMIQHQKALEEGMKAN